MNTLVVFDSDYGNTEQVARTIAGAIGQTNNTPLDEVAVLRVSEVTLFGLSSVDLLIVGSPTQGGRPTPELQKFLRSIPANALEGIRVAAFDTRFSSQGRSIAMRILLGIMGYAAGRIGSSLASRGGHLVMPPEGFIVEDKEGPLKEGELERAAGWAKSVARASNPHYQASRVPIR